ncbi:MAG: HAD-IA family hydrolase [Candidatus Moranbacteria bacterium]|nr:HAD-IA family hydrolase [Candidatus Moranbacteria bacterium]
MNGIKAILLDIDGLLLKKQRYFSEIYSEQCGVPTESILPFFRSAFGRCQVGAADLKEELLPYLEAWKWNGTVEAFLEYWFSFCILDDDVMSVVRSLRRDGLKCYVVSQQEKYRTEYIRKNVIPDDEIDGSFYSFELGMPKSDTRFFDAVLEALHLPPEAVVFFDDEEENVEVGRSLGITSVLVEGGENFRDVVKQNVRA